MKIDPALQAHVVRAFAPLNNQAAVNSFFPPASRARELDNVSPGPTGVVPQARTPKIAKMFATAAVDMWMRAVHSFLISASLTDVSPIWASATGYYSSHYTVRSIAHLLGFFQLFKRRRIVRLELDQGHFVCSFNPKTHRDHEHLFYWKVVKANPLFAGDLFFTENTGDDSDAAHRNRANYGDHLSQFPAFRPLDAVAVRNRIERISEIEFEAPPIPQVARYPDVISVQIIAYHRLMRFRDLVDAIIGTGNRFWRVYRDPAWVRDFMDFQITESRNLRSEFTL